MKAAPHRAASDTTKLGLASEGRHVREVPAEPLKRKGTANNFHWATLSGGAARHSKENRHKMAAHHVSNVVTQGDGPHGGTALTSPPRPTLT